MLKKISLVFLATASLIFYIKYRLLKKELNKQIIFKQRHNCVVMYNANKGMSGWPPYKNRILPSIVDEKSLNILYEPIIFFLSSATKSLDVAYMSISIQKIFDAIIETQKRGVKVRVLLNFDNCNNNLDPIRKCLKEGIDVLCYISHKPNLESIMHYKYMVKDYEENGGYVLIGSLNLNRSAFFENYEDIVITSDTYLAKTIHNNFEKCWSDIQSENQTLLNKTTLWDVNLF